MIEKIKTLLWFVKRPSFWAYAVELALRKAREDKDRQELRSKAGAWAKERAVSVDEALQKLGLNSTARAASGMPEEIVREAEKRAELSSVAMGGPGDLKLIYLAVVITKARCVIETGVAYGWSSLAILAGMDGRDEARLVSVDMPYPKMNNEPFVGIVVPDRMRAQWTLVREPDRNGIAKAISTLGGKIDFCHYDSDKSWWGRKYAYPLLWDALQPGGIFISDDIQDNMAFAEFVAEKNLPFAVTESQGKFVGIIRKPELA